jgi:serine phosphatase RsbU (regulator of sigma subunit)
VRIDNKIKDNRRIKKIYDFYAKDLDLREIDRFFREDAKKAYEYYLKEYPDNKKTGNSFSHLIHRVWDFFIAFLSKFTPFRRILYTLAIVIFLLGFFDYNQQQILIAFLLLNLLIMLELADKLTAKEELNIARNIQIEIMSKNVPHDENYEIAAYSEAANEVGGDYYEFFKCEHSEINSFFILGDISGKGMSAALTMIQIQAALKTILMDDKSPKQILIELNVKLNRLLKRDEFITAIFGCIKKNGDVVLCRAGHTPIIYYSMKDMQCGRIKPSGIGIGPAFSKHFDSYICEKTVAPEQGDILVFYTDGVTEMENGSKIQFGEENLLSIVSRNAGKSPAEIMETIKLSLMQFRNYGSSSDDSSLIIMKRI